MKFVLYIYELVNYAGKKLNYERAGIKRIGKTF